MGKGAAGATIGGGVRGGAFGGGRVGGGVKNASASMIRSGFELGSSRVSSKVASAFSSREAFPSPVKSISTIKTGLPPKGILDLSPKGSRFANSHEQKSRSEIISERKSRLLSATNRRSPYSGKSTELSRGVAVSLSKDRGGNFANTLGIQRNSSEYAKRGNSPVPGEIRFQNIPGKINQQSENRAVRLEKLKSTEAPKTSEVQNTSPVGEKQTRERQLSSVRAELSKIVKEKQSHAGFQLLQKIGKQENQKTEKSKARKNFPLRSTRRYHDMFSARQKQKINSVATESAKKPIRIPAEKIQSLPKDNVVKKPEKQNVILASKKAEKVKKVFQLLDQFKTQSRVALYENNTKKKKLGLSPLVSKQKSQESTSVGTSESVTTAVTQNSIPVTPVETSVGHVLPVPKGTSPIVREKSSFGKTESTQTLKVVKTVVVFQPGTETYIKSGIAKDVLSAEKVVRLMEELQPEKVNKTDVRSRITSGLQAKIEKQGLSPYVQFVDQYEGERAESHHQNVKEKSTIKPEDVVIDTATNHERQQTAEKAFEAVSQKVKKDEPKVIQAEEVVKNIPNEPQPVHLKSEILKWVGLLDGTLPRIRAGIISAGTFKTLEEFREKIRRLIQQFPAGRVGSNERKLTDEEISTIFSQKQVEQAA